MSTEDRLRAALLAVEFVGAGSLPAYCPWCRGDDPDDIPREGNVGHRPDCQRQLALMEVVDDH